MESQFTIPNRSVTAEMASAVTDDSLPSRKRHTDDREDYEEEGSLTAENRALSRKKIVRLSDFQTQSVRLLSDFCPTSVRLLSDTDKLKVSENVGLSVRHSSPTSFLESATSPRNFATPLIATPLILLTEIPASIEKFPSLPSLSDLSLIRLALRGDRHFGVFVVDKFRIF